MLIKTLLQNVPGVSLATFRIFFGSLMAVEILRYFILGRIFTYYIKNKFFFTYEFFPFISPWPSFLLYAHFVALIIFAIGIALGFFYRFCCLMFFLGYSYVFLLDKAQHNNHYYLIILLSFIMIFLKADNCLALRKSTKTSLVPYWNLFWLRAQVVIVYFYAGVAKINSDWLYGEPIRTWLRERSNSFLVGPLFHYEPTVYFFVYGGIFFDLLVGPLLLYKKTRPWIIPVVFFFHLTNTFLFSIGIFPWLMMAITIIFLEPHWPNPFFKLFSSKLSVHFLPHKTFAPTKTFLLIFIFIYLIIQILLPWRHWLYPGNVAWTEDGHLFSWRMKLRDKRCIINFLVITNPKTRQQRFVNAKEDLSLRQISKMSVRPGMILQYAHYLKKKYTKNGIEPEVYAYALASLNGRPWQYFVDFKVNLAKEKFSLFSHTTWILPLKPRPKKNRK